MLRRLTNALSIAAAVGIGAMACITLVDILANNLMRTPIRGTFDLVQLLLATTIFLGVPEVFRLNRNIVVDVIDHFVSTRAKFRFEHLARLITLCFMSILLYAMITPALDTVRYPEHKQETGIPTWIYWLPILFGVATSVVVLAMAEWQELRSGEVHGSA